MLKKNSGAIKTAYAIVLAIIITGAVVGAGVWYYTKPPTPADALEIYSWWTSGGEKAAIDALVAVFENDYPNVSVVSGSVSGGAGVVFQSVINSRVIAGEAPDSFQVHAGYEVKPYVDGSYLDPINDLWNSEGWENVFPSVVKDLVNFSGNYYAVPLDIHRANVVWYNKHVLDGNGINASNIKTWDDFYAACDKLSQNTSLIYPGSKFSVISLGTSDKFGAAHIFEQMMASEGIGFYQDFINGKVTDPTNTTLRDALTNFARYVNYTNADYPTLTWDQATAMVINGYSTTAEGAAFNIMGDWANGEFLKANAIYNTDYGTFAVPGTSNMYGLVVDCFEHPKGIKHPDNSLNWLKVVGSEAGQVAFNPLKGSIPCLTNLTASDIAKFGPYQQGAIADFTTLSSTGYLYPSIVHGSGMPVDFKTELFDIILTLLSNSRKQSSGAAVGTAATSITQDVTSASSELTKVWTLVH